MLQKGWTTKQGLAMPLIATGPPWRARRNDYPDVEPKLGQDRDESSLAREDSEDPH